MKHTPLLFTAFLLAGICCAGVALAEDMNHMGHKDPAAMAERMEKIDNELGISTEQKTKMQAVRQEFGTLQKAVREELKAKKDELKALLDSDAPDRTKANALAAAINTLQEKMMAAHIDQLFKIRAILTPEQYKKFTEKRKAHREEKKEERKEKRNKRK